MKKQLKRLVVLGTTAAMLATSALGVSASGLRDVFDAKYYADTYKDLKEAFGDDEEALYQHFLNNGLTENRQMSPIIDVQAYRAAYPDLEAAFGDNWDAYVEHFIEYGAKENRTKGVLFNPLKYAEAYPDVAAAFGSDIRAIVQHYLTSGIKEGRTAGVVVKEQEATPSSGGGSQEPTAPPVKRVTAFTDLTGGITTPVPVNSTATGSMDGTETTMAVVEIADSSVDVSSKSGLISLTADLTGGTTSEAAKVKATIKPAAVAALEGKVSAIQASDTLAVTVKAKPATVTLPLEALQMAKRQGAANADIVLEVNPGTPLTAGATDVNGWPIPVDNAAVVDIALKVGDAPATIEGLAKPIQITVPVTGMTADDDVYIFYQDGTALRPVGKGKVSSSGSPLTVSFKVNHLTEFVFVTGHVTDAGHVASMFTDPTSTSSTCKTCGLTVEDWRTAHATVTAEHKGNSTDPRKCVVCGDSIHPTGLNAAGHVAADFTDRTDPENTCGECSITVGEWCEAKGTHTDAGEGTCSTCGGTVDEARAKFFAHELDNFDADNDGACKGDAGEGCGVENCDYDLETFQAYCKDTAGDGNHKDETGDDRKCDRCGDEDIAFHPTEDASKHTIEDFDTEQLKTGAGDCNRKDEGCTISADDFQKAKCGDDTPSHTGSSGDECSVCGFTIT